MGHLVQNLKLRFQFQEDHYWTDWLGGTLKSQEAETWQRNYIRLLAFNILLPRSWHCFNYPPENEIDNAMNPSTGWCKQGWISLHGAQTKVTHYNICKINHPAQIFIFKHHTITVKFRFIFKGKIIAYIRPMLYHFRWQVPHTNIVQYPSHLSLRFKIYGDIREGEFEFGIQYLYV
jgi:hypothetical protein